MQAGEKPDLISGVILAGGKSSRFGQDKGLFRYRGNLLIEYAIEALTPTCNELLISTNQPGHYSFTGLRTIEDIYPDCGPIGGIHSGLTHASGNLVIFAGCDMPHLGPDIFKFLIGTMKGFDAVVPLNKGFRETLVVAMRKSCLKSVEDTIGLGKYKLLDMLQELNTGFYEVTTQPFYREGLFHNINTLQDAESGPNTQ